MTGLFTKETALERARKIFWDANDSRVCQVARALVEAQIAALNASDRIVLTGTLGTSIASLRAALAELKGRVTYGST